MCVSRSSLYVTYLSKEWHLLGVDTERVRGALFRSARVLAPVAVKQTILGDHWSPMRINHHDAVNSAMQCAHWYLSSCFDRSYHALGSRTFPQVHPPDTPCIGLRNVRTSLQPGRRLSYIVEDRKAIVREGKCPKGKRPEECSGGGCPSLTRFVLETLSKRSNTHVCRPLCPRYGLSVVFSRPY